MRTCFFCQKLPLEQLFAGPMFGDFCSDRHRVLYAEWKYKCATGSNQDHSPIFKHVEGPARNIAPAPTSDFKPQGFPRYPKLKQNAGHPVCQRKKED